MANTFSALLPTLIAQNAIKILKARSGFINRVRVETIQQNIAAGGDTVTIPKEVAEFTPTDVSYSSGGTVQDAVITSVPLVFAFHKEVKIKVNELEERIAQQGWDRIKKLTLPGMIQGIVRLVDRSLGGLYTDAASSVGVGGTAITDPVLRLAAAGLATNGVDLTNEGMVHLVMSTGGYFNGLLGIDRYVTALNVGDNVTIRGGKIPSLFNIGADYSQNVTSTTVAGSPPVVTQHGLMFEQDAMTIGFMEFAPAGSPVVDEVIMTDPDSGISLRVQTYYDPNLRTKFFQIDVKWGVVTTDSLRMIEVKH